MKKLQLVLVMLVALCALGALYAGSASAEVTLVALWLVNGEAITANLASEITGTIKLEDTKVPLIGDAAFSCSGIFVGTVGAEGKDTITSLLTLTGTAISSTPLSGTLLSNCTNVLNCGTPIEVWPVGLPWKTQLFLMVGTAGEPILDLTTGSAGGGHSFGYEIVCTELGVKVTDECTNEDAELLVQNNATTGNAETPSGVQSEPAATCSLDKEATGLNETTSIATIELAEKGKEGLLSVSSE